VGQAARVTFSLLLAFGSRFADTRALGPSAILLLPWAQACLPEILVPALKDLTGLHFVFLKQRCASGETSFHALGLTIQANSRRCFISRDNRLSIGAGVLAVNCGDIDYPASRARRLADILAREAL
jgi:hypothetical protein